MPRTYRDFITAAVEAYNEGRLQAQLSLKADRDLIPMYHDLVHNCVCVLGAALDTYPEEVEGAFFRLCHKTLDFDGSEEELLLLDTLQEYHDRVLTTESHSLSRSEAFDQFKSLLKIYASELGLELQEPAS